MTKSNIQALLELLQAITNSLGSWFHSLINLSEKSPFLMPTLNFP